MVVPAPHASARGADRRHGGPWPPAQAWFALLLSLLFTVTCAAGSDEVVTIVNNDNSNVVDRAFVVKAYTGAIKGWPDGAPVLPLDQAQGSHARDAFCLAVLGKRPTTVSAIWSQNIFTGRGLPPRAVNGDAEMKRFVARHRNAIGYVLRSQLDGSVRALDR